MCQHGLEVEVLPALPIRIFLPRGNLRVGERDPRAIFGLLERNLNERIRRLVGEFRRPPGLNDKLIRYQFESRAEDVSIPGSEFAADLAVHFRRTARVIAV